MTDTRPSNPYAQAYADFLEPAKDHRLVVLHMDGLYRHLRVQAPGTRMWSWDIKRSARHADHAYTTVAQQYRDAASVASLRLWCTDGLTEDQIDELIQKHCFSALSDTSISEQSPAERRATIIDSARLHAGTENGAHTWLSEHEELVGCDTWEWDLRDWNIHFLFACYAIDLTVQLYRQHQAAMESSEHDPDVAAQVNKRLRELADATKQHQRAGSESETAA